MRREQALSRHLGNVDLAAARTLSGCSAESGATTSAASFGSSAGASGAGERRHCRCPGCPNGSRTRCSACKSVEYCSRACQKLHWAAHKAACKVMSPGKAESGPSMLTIILVLLVLLGGAYFAFAPAGAADKAEL
jgi:hypothetical protein